MYIFLAVLMAGATGTYDRCGSCHAKEVEGFSHSAMARSISLADHAPAGTVDHEFSGTRVLIESENREVRQTLERSGQTESLVVQYAIGSGNHATGYLARIGDHLFQSPVAYYSKRGQWDVAPGYEGTRDPDFSRPVTIECLTCHSGKPLEKRDTLNSYDAPYFAPLAIGCERCHGDPTAHLKAPLPGSIVNPSRLSAAARDSVCEQCHLAGEARVPNPGKSISDFRPGTPLEDTFTVYVAPRGPQGTIKVISHSEQLAQSACARNSGGRLWCGTCHNPHEIPANKTAYYRARCLSCHASTLDKAHAAQDRDCVVCHMPRRAARDGGHTAFTDHRITRHPEPEGSVSLTGNLAAWREPATALRERNLALALVTVGSETNNRDEVIRGYRMLNQVLKKFSNDTPVLTAVGTIVLKANEAGAAQQYFRRASALRPNYAPYRVNLASALLASGDSSGAAVELEQAIQLDPLLEQAVELLSRVYRMEGQPEEADALMDKYRSAMGMTSAKTK